MTLSRKGAKSRTRIPGLRSTRTKATAYDARIDDLEKKLAEALERQTATSEVLQVISRSPGGLEPVFQAMLTNAVRVCEGKFGVLFRYRDNAFHVAATLDVPPRYAEFLGRRPFRPDVERALAGSPLHRLLLSKEIVQSDDVLSEANPGPAAQYGGARSFIAVPLKKESELVGAFVIYRQEVRPFTDRHRACHELRRPGRHSH